MSMNGKKKTLTKLSLFRAFRKLDYGPPIGISNTKTKMKDVGN